MSLVQTTLPASVHNCTFMHNTAADVEIVSAVTGCDKRGCAGAMCIEPTAAVNISHATFVNNSAHQGGAVMVAGCADAKQCPVVLHHAHFNDNTAAPSLGAALYTQTPEAVMLQCGSEKPFPAANISALVTNISVAGSIRPSNSSAAACSSRLLGIGGSGGVQAGALSGPPARLTTNVSWVSGVSSGDVIHVAVSSACSSHCLSVSTASLLAARVAGFICSVCCNADSGHSHMLCQISLIKLMYSFVHSCNSCQCLSTSCMCVQPQWCCGRALPSGNGIY